MLNSLQHVKFGHIVNVDSSRYHRPHPADIHFKLTDEDAVRFGPLLGLNVNDPKNPSRNAHIRGTSVGYSSGHGPEVTVHANKSGDTLFIVEGQNSSRFANSDCQTEGAKKLSASSPQTSEYVDLLEALFRRLQEPAVSRLFQYWPSDRYRSAGESLTELAQIFEKITGRKIENIPEHTTAGV